MCFAEGVRGCGKSLGATGGPRGVNLERFGLGGFCTLDAIRNCSRGEVLEILIHGVKIFGVLAGEKSFAGFALRDGEFGQVVAAVVPTEGRFLVLILDVEVAWNR